MTRSTGIGGGLAAETGVGWLDVEAGPDATLGVDAGGLISRANAAALALLGYPREELVGSSVDVLLPERLRAAVGADRAGVLEYSEDWATLVLTHVAYGEACPRSRSASTSGDSFPGQTGVCSPARPCSFPPSRPCRPKPPWTRRTGSS